MAYNMPPQLSTVADKIKSIITPKAPIGKLTPTRDLRGTWVSSLPGKAIQLYGSFKTPGAVTEVYEDGDMELIIEKVENNIAYGKIRQFNYCGYGKSHVENYGTISVPKTCLKDTGFQPIEITVSASALDFGTINFDGGTATMQGSYTTDLMSGTMTLVIPSGTVKGEFHLNRKQ